jgi:hypothetical protein
MRLMASSAMGDLLDVHSSKVASQMGPARRLADPRLAGHGIGLIELPEP